MSSISFQFYSMEIPFKESFSHASATRRRTASVWIEARLNGKTGYGEGCPRSYVSGENKKSARSFFDRVTPELGTIESVRQLQQWVNDHHDLIDQNPAAWCAIELSMLDLFGKIENSSVETMLGLTSLQQQYKYTAILGQSCMPRFRQTVDRYLALGMRDMKLKLSGDIKSDSERMLYLHSHVPGLRLRLDANNFWHDAGSAVANLSSLPSDCFAIEEPIQAGDYIGLDRLARHLRVRVILDESFMRLQDMAHISSKPEQWIINLRVSKMGGLFRSIDIIHAAKKASIPIIVGAQVGETSLLTRAGMIAASFASKIVIAQEGAFGNYLLTEDVCTPSLMFGEAGELDTKQLINNDIDGFGLDIGVSSKLLRRVHPDSAACVTS